MAAKSKNRLLKTQNKLLEFDKILLRDVICSICQSILLEPVTLPCFHNFCQSCFKSSIENNSLCCPLCRLRIGSWLRTTTKQNKIVNAKLWDFIQSKFSKEVNTKLQGEDLNLSQDQPRVCLSEPGEIRAEYEAELKRLQSERLQQEQKQLQETSVLIKKIQEEDDETNKKYLGILKQDEILAKQVQEENNKRRIPAIRPRQTLAPAKPKLKTAKIDAFLTKTSTTYKSNPLLIDDSTNSSICSDSGAGRTEPQGSPEMVPGYSEFVKNVLNKTIRNMSGIWNKENGEKCKTKEPVIIPQVSNSDAADDKDQETSPNATQSLPVSLPYTGILQHKINTLEKRSVGSGSVDSMRQELCYFKPIQGTTTTSYNAKRGLPLRVTVIRLEKPDAVVPKESPTCMQYVQGLCLLRHRSLADNLPSAFVIALNKDGLIKGQLEAKCKAKPSASTNGTPASINRRNAVVKSKHSTHDDGIDKLNNDTSLRRTRSMGSISKADTETTPKKTKTKVRQAVSERKPYLRSESKKLNAQNAIKSPPLNSDSLNNNKVINLAVKNLSSPLQHCDVKKIFEEQLRIVKQMEQEKQDLELARRLHSELNPRTLRRAPAKRPRARPRPRPTALGPGPGPGPALRPAKKLKV